MVLLENNPIDSFECICTHLEKWTMQIFYFTFHTRTKFVMFQASKVVQ
jgi:hypothetical protein